MTSMEHLIRLGLNVNEAKALAALVALGPSGASAVHRQAGIPRNKAYEVLEKRASKGLVEIQNGHPILYRAIGAKAIIGAMTENYGSEAKEALTALERQEALSEVGKEDGDDYGDEGGTASAWMVKG